MSSRRSNLQSFRVNKDSTNAGLWLDKFIVRQDDLPVNYSEKQAKQTLVDEVSNIKVPDIYESFFNDIWNPSLEKYTPQCIEISGRMIVGLGAESVLETSITLHRTYGVPYIPGSALKGLAASYAHRFMGDDWKKEPKETKDKVTKETKKIGEAHKLMFGSQELAGYVIFHDALYVPNSYGKNPKNPLATDILTVHHSEYYKDGKSAPADWDNPIPIPLLSAQGKYLLAVSANSGDAKFDEKMTGLAIEILTYALKDEGIGAKTSSGYGRARIVDYSAKIDESSKSSEVETTGSQGIQNNPTEPPKTEEERNADRFKGIKERLEAIGNYEKDNFNKIFKSIKKLPIEKQIEGVDLMISIAHNDPSNPVFENASWFIESKEILKKRKI
jgi:CRISPR-associated protein Cmr6